MTNYEHLEKTINNDNDNNKDKNKDTGKFTQIGSGYYSTVYSHSNNEGSVYKALKYSFCDGKEGHIESTVINEILHLKKLHHPNITSIKNVHFDIIEFEKMDGDIKALFNDTEVTIEIFDNLLHSLLNAAEYIHSVGTMHCDIRPANILYKKINDKIIFKLCDFNVAQYIPYDGIDKSSKNFASESFIYSNFEFKTF